MHDANITTLLKKHVSCYVCDLLMFIVAHPYALVEVSLQGVQLCDYIHISTLTNRFEHTIKPQATEKTHTRLRLDVSRS